MTNIKTHFFPPKKFVSFSLGWAEFTFSPVEGSSVQKHPWFWSWRWNKVTKSLNWAFRRKESWIQNSIYISWSSWEEQVRVQRCSCPEGVSQYQAKLFCSGSVSNGKLTYSLASGVFSIGGMESLCPTTVYIRLCSFAVLPNKRCGKVFQTSSAELVLELLLRSCNK